MHNTNIVGLNPSLRTRGKLQAQHKFKLGLNAKRFDTCQSSLRTLRILPIGRINRNAVSAIRRDTIFVLRFDLLLLFIIGLKGLLNVFITSVAMA